MSHEIQPDPSNHPHEHEPQATSKPMSQGIQTDTLNHSDEYESEDDWNPVPSYQHIQVSPDPSYDSVGYEAESNDSDMESLRRTNHIMNDPFRKERKERKRYLETYLPLYEASLRCDWKAAAAILDKNPDMNLVRCKITENGETALHIAASAKAPKEKVDEFVKNLVERMTSEDLELVNNNQSTALYLATAAGNIETVKIMMEKNETLDRIPGGGGDMMPLYAAVLFGHKDVAEYLYKWSRELRNDGWTDRRRSLFLEKCVESDLFDIAIQIVEKYPELGRSNSSNLLGLLARKPEAFHEKKSVNTESNIIRRTIKSVSAFFEETPVQKGDALSLLTILMGCFMEATNREIDDILRGPRDSIKSRSGRIVQTIQLKQLIVYHLNKLVAETQTLKKGTLSEEKLKEIISKHVVNLHVETQSLIKQQNTTDEDQALDLQKLISEIIGKLHDETCGKNFNFHFVKRFILEFTSDHIEKLKDETEIRATYSSRVLFIAAEVGNTNFLIELIRTRPDLIWQVDDNGLSIFHIAVKHRHEGIYNLIYEIGSMKDMVTPLTDNDGNNMLHLAAMRTRKKNLSLAALQMQRDLLWFKEVERMIPPYLRVIKNKDGFTPRELFTNEHQDLIEQGEESLKSTANKCMVVATLVATIVFAAAFTVPGGYNQNDGIPMFNRKLSFAVFVVADAMSLFLSSTSILIFTSFFISFGYTERDFEELLPRRLMLGIVTLYFSIGAMLVTYSVNFFVIYHKEMKWIHIFFSLFAVSTASGYFLLQVNLLNDVFRTIYGGKYLFKPKNQVLQVLTNIVFQL